MEQTARDFIDWLEFGGVMAAAVFSSAVIVLMYWWRPRAKLLLRPAHWEAQRDRQGIYVLGRVHAMTPNGMVATEEIEMSISLPGGESLTVGPKDKSQLGRASLADSPQFMFCFPDLDVEVLEVTLRVKLVDGPKEYATFSLSVPKKAG